MAKRVKNKFKDYFLAHWNGEQGLLRTCLFNGVIVPILGSLVLSVVLGVILVVFFCVFLKLQNLPLSNSYFHPFIDACVLLIIAITFLFEVWAFVGILRCGYKNAASKLKSAKTRVGGIIAIIWGLLIAYNSVSGVFELYIHRNAFL